MSLPYIVEKALGRQPGDSSLPYPAFDPEHPDEILLDAFENLRASYSWQVQQWEAGNRELPAAFSEAVATECAEARKIIAGAWASTPAGIAARVTVAMVELSEDALVEGIAMTNGLAKVYAARKDFNDLRIQQLAEAAYELINFDWRQTLDEYRRAASDYKMAQALTEAAENLEASGAGAEQVAAIKALVASNEARACHQKQLRALMMTVTPDAEDLQTKTQILCKEGVSNEALPWLARDLAFITGWIDGTSKRAEPFDFSSVGAQSEAA